jgi:hypothetical protein
VSLPCPASLLALASERHRLGDHAAAFAAASDAVALEPGGATGWHTLCGLAYDIAQLEAAIDCGHRAMACDPASDADSLVGAALVASGRWREALPLFERATSRRHGPPALPEPTTTFAKLKHDAEQIEHLVGVGHLPPALSAAAADYRAIMAMLPREGNPAVVLEGETRRRVAATYNRLLYRDAGATLDGSALNPALDAGRIERAYDRSRPQVAVIDDFLRPDALAALWRYCQDSTVWFAGTYPGGYVGAQMGDGFAAPLLFQIADEMKALLPGIIGDEGLHHLWAFKYDSGFSVGTDLHADAARINVNFWVTPDAANLDPDRGGLEIFDVAAPADWDFDSGDFDAVRRHIEQSGARSLIVPHRQNRAVLFDSDLFHRTDVCRFRDGYMNRRINVTMLYGTRRSAAPSS